MSRRANLDLTEQQERVLRLMARGRTNFEIAQDLDVTLDGAKYHIRQVFDKLGVDSREEAVAAWKASRGSLFERVRGWLWPVGAVVVGGAAVVAVVVVGAIALLGGDDGSNAGVATHHTPAAANVPAGIWVAMIAPPEPKTGGSDIGSLRVFSEADPTGGHTFPRVFYALPFALEWSHDGARLTAIGSTGDGPKDPTAIFVFERDGATWTTKTIAVPSIGPRFSWSPDDSLLAVIDTDELGRAGLTATLYDSAAKPVDTTKLPKVGSPSYGIDYLPAWRNDSRAAAWGVNGHLLVLTPGGIHDYASPGGKPEHRVRAVDWADDDHVDVILSNMTDGDTGYRVRVGSKEASWKKLGQPPATQTLPLLPTPGLADAALWNHPSGVPLINVGTTADGGAVVFGPGYAAASAGLVIDFQIIVDGGGQPTAIDLGRLAAPSVGLGSTYAVVVTK